MKEFAPYYYTIYMFIVMLMTIMRFVEIKSLRGYSVIYKRDNYLPMVIISVLFILIWGFRPVSIAFGDTVNYNATYDILQTIGTMKADLPAELYWCVFFLWICS